MRTASAPKSAIDNLRFSDDEALEYQVEFLHYRRPVILEARGVVSLFRQMFDDFATKKFIRECLQRVPRERYELLYMCVRPELEIIKRSDRHRARFVQRCEDPEFIPYSYNWQRAEFLRIEPKEAMLLPDRRYLDAATEEARCSRIRRSRVGASAKEILKNFKGSWRMYVNTTTKSGRRWKVIYAIARGMADQGATADEIETVVRSSKAFQSKSGPFHLDGQGKAWGEQEIKRMRKLAR